MNRKLIFLFLAVTAFALITLPVSAARLSPELQHVKALFQGDEPPGETGANAAMAAASNAITYQGQLLDGNSPANGVYDLQFKLFNAASAGTQEGFTVLLEDVSVSQGLFTVDLNFGEGVYTGDRWLEIGVRPGASTADFTVLAPLQRLAPAPYALVARSAPNLQGHVTIDNSASGEPALRLEGSSGNLFGAALEMDNGPMAWRINVNTGNDLSFVKGTGSTFTPFKIADESFQDALYVGQNGVGIGTDSPTHMLEVNGAAHVSEKLTAGPNNVSLPIAYGFINGNGTVANATANVTSSLDSANNRYVISISGEDYYYTQYVTLVTVGVSNCIARTGSTGGNLLVYTADRATGNSIQCNFQFVMYKP